MDYRHRLLVRRGIEIAAHDTAYCAEFAVSIIHIAHMSCELVHRFFTNRNVLSDFTAVAFEMECVNQQDMPRRDFVSGKSKSAWRKQCAIP